MPTALADPHALNCMFRMPAGSADVDGWKRGRQRISQDAVDLCQLRGTELGGRPELFEIDVAARSPELDADEIAGRLGDLLDAETDLNFSPHVRVESLGPRVGNVTHHGGNVDGAVDSCIGQADRGSPQLHLGHAVQVAIVIDLLHKFRDGGLRVDQSGRVVQRRLVLPRRPLEVAKPATRRGRGAVPPAALAAFGNPTREGWRLRRPAEP